MSIKDILEAKPGGRSVTTIDGSHTLTRAAQFMTENKIGALLVLGANRKILGIITERDILRQIGEGGADALSKSVSQVMTREVITCKIDAPIAGVEWRMNKGRFRHMPVVNDNGEVMGLVSSGDITKCRFEESRREADALRNYV